MSSAPAASNARERASTAADVDGGQVYELAEDHCGKNHLGCRLEYFDQPGLTPHQRDAGVAVREKPTSHVVRSARSLRLPSSSRARRPRPRCPLWLGTGSVAGAIRLQVVDEFVDLAEFLVRQPTHLVDEVVQVCGCQGRKIAALSTGRIRLRDAFGSDRLRFRGFEHPELLTWGRALANEFESRTKPSDASGEPEL